MVRKAIASVIDEESVTMEILDNLKIGDGKISIDYYLDNCDYSFGSITVYSNGGIIVVIDEEEYANVIYNDYLKINGSNPQSLQDMKADYGMSTISNDFDKERWNRVKKLIADNNIELRYLEDINMDRAEEQNMDYESYLEKERKIFDSFKIK